MSAKPTEGDVHARVAIRLDHPPLPCRASPPQGGRLAASAPYPFSPPGTGERRRGRSQRRGEGGWCRRSGSPPGRVAATLPSKGRKAAVPYPLTLATQRHQPASSPRKTFKSMRLSTAPERPEPEYCQKTQSRPG